MATVFLPSRCFFSTASASALHGGRARADACSAVRSLTLLAVDTICLPKASRRRWGRPRLAYCRIELGRDDPVLDALTHGPEHNPQFGCARRRSSNDLSALRDNVESDFAVRR